MIFKNSFHLLVDNFTLGFKMLLYKLICWAVTIGLSAALLYPTLSALFSSVPFIEASELIVDFFKALVSGNTDFLATFAEQLSEKMSALISYIQNNMTGVVYFVLSVALVVLVARFLSGLGNFAFGYLIDNKMSSYAKVSFTGALVSNLGKASLWQLIYVPVTFVYDLIVLAVCYTFFLILLNVISISLVAAFMALMLSVALFLCSQALKLTFFNGVVPALVCDKMKMGAAIRAGVSSCKGRFSMMFTTYLVAVLIILCTNVLCGVSSFGAALLLTIPVSYLLLICIQFVSGYTFSRKKYFLNKDTIVKPEREEGDAQSFYDDFEI